MLIPRSADQRLAQAVKSTMPGTLGGRVASARPVRRREGQLAARTTPPAEPAAGGSSGTALSWAQWNQTFAFAANQAGGNKFSYSGIAAGEDYASWAYTDLGRPAADPGGLYHLMVNAVSTTALGGQPLGVEVVFNTSVSTAAPRTPPSGAIFPVSLVNSAGKSGGSFAAMIADPNYFNVYIAPHSGTTAGNITVCTTLIRLGDLA